MTIRRWPSGHAVRHGSVMDAEGIADLMNGEKATIMYSDPPWGDGNLKYWRTVNKKMTGEDTPEQPPLNHFLARLFAIATVYVRGVVFIEYGVRWEQEIVDGGRAAGLHYAGRATPVYAGGGKLLPLHLHVFYTPGCMGRLPSDTLHTHLDFLHGLKGLPCVRHAVAPFVEPGGILLDPCCGMGYSAQVAMDGGMRFRGNELNVARLAKTIARLERGA